MKYSMQCTCGHTIEVDAESREDGVKKIKDIMTPDAIAAHMKDKHAGQPVPSNDQVYAMIEQATNVEGAAAAM